MKRSLRFGAILSIILLLSLCCVASAVADYPIYYISKPPIVYNLFSRLSMDLKVSPTTGDTTTPYFTITASALYSNGTPVGAGYEIALTTSPSKGGNLEYTEYSTYKNDNTLTSKFYVSSPGDYTINATVTDPYGNYLPGTASIKLKVLPPPVKPTPSWYVTQKSGNAPLTVAFTDKSTGVPTSWFWDFGDGGTSTQQSPAYTYNDPGSYTVTLTVTNAQGSNTYKNAAQPIVVNQAPGGAGGAGGGGGTGGNSSGGGVTASPSAGPGTVSAAPSVSPTIGGADISALIAIVLPLLPYLAIGLIVLLLFIIVLAILWLRRKLRVEAKKVSAPCDGKSTIPIRVYFTNSFGRVRRARSDIEVTMETTAGSIPNAVLQNGRDFVDVSLVTSKEFGPVTVTGRMNGKTARTKVNFTYGQAKLDIAVTPASIPADAKSTAKVSIRIMDDGGNFIAPLEDKAIELKTTLGNVVSPLRLAARQQEVNATITAGDQSGTAVITAICGSLKGEASLAVQDTPKRFCMHCGSSMSMEAAKCPKCGLTPPSGVDTKPCSTCGTILPEPAGFCYKCGARQPETAKAPTAGDKETANR
jgi:PKD repeat protein/ribosomal protein L40E